MVCAAQLLLVDLIYIVLSVCFLHGCCCDAGGVTSRLECVPQSTLWFALTQFGKSVVRLAFSASCLCATKLVNKSCRSAGNQPAFVRANVDTQSW